VRAENAVISGWMLSLTSAFRYGKDHHHLRMCSFDVIFYVPSKTNLFWPRNLLISPKTIWFICAPMLGRWYPGYHLLGLLRTLLDTFPGILNFHSNFVMGTDGKREFKNGIGVESSVLCSVVLIC